MSPILKVFLKVIRFPLVLIPIYIFFTVLAGGLFSGGGLSIEGRGFGELLLDGIGSTILVFVAYSLLAKLIENRNFLELPFNKNGFVDFFKGFGLGTLLISATVATLWALGMYSATLNTFNLAGIFGIFLILLPAALREELMFRGAFFRILEEKLGSWGALILQMLFFGFAHMASPNASIYLAILIALEAGLLFGAVYIYKRNLWLCFGMHLAWNFAQGVIFGSAISGNSVGYSILKSNINGPYWLAGSNEQGLEPSFVALVFSLTLASYYMYKVITEKKIIQPFWVKSKNS